MYPKLDVSVSELLRMREEGMSNRCIANVLGIHYGTVYKYIGPQGKKMENMAAFKEEPTKPEAPAETPEIKRAVDEIVVRTEKLSSKNGNAMADVDYMYRTVSLDIGTLSFDELAEFATFVIGMVERITREVKKC